MRPGDQATRRPGDQATGLEEEPLAGNVQGDCLDDGGRHSIQDCERI